MTFFISHVISTRDAHISPKMGYKANVGNYLSRFIAKFPIKFYLVNMKQSSLTKSLDWNKDMFGKYVERCLLFADDIVLIGITEEELVITNSICYFRL